MPPDDPDNKNLASAIGIPIGILVAALTAGSLFKRRTRKNKNRADGLTDALLEDGVSQIPIEISKQGRAAIQAYNTALLGGKQRLNWAKLMFVGQERVGKSSLLRNLTNQQHDPKELTTDGTDICIVETSDWVRLEQQPMYPSRFDQSVASSVGNALVGLHTR